MELGDGTIIPHYLGVSDRAAPEPSEAFGNVLLRHGEVKELIWPNDPRSVSKKYLEYRVQVQHRDPRGVPITTEYPSCYAANLFGGVADRLFFTYREDVASLAKNAGLGQGSKVILLCLNGEANNAVILGGLRDATDIKDDPAKDHHLDFTFNGVQATIDKAGAFALAFKGATQATGELSLEASASNSGTRVAMEANGDLILEHGEQRLWLQHGEKTWRTRADRDIITDANHDWVASASNIATLIGDKGVEVETSATCSISSAITKIGSATATEPIIKGISHRTIEATKNVNVIAMLNWAMAATTTLTGLVTAAGANLQATSAAHKVPIVGPIVGSIPLQVAATSLNAAAGPLVTIASALASISAALTAYETAAPTTLSVKNFVDN